MACLIMPSNPYATTAKTTRQTTLTENCSHSLHWQTAAWSTEQNEIKHGSLEACFVKVELFLTWLCVFKIQRLWCKTLEKTRQHNGWKKIILTFGNSTIYRFLKVLFARFLFFCYTNYLDLRAFLSKYWYMWWIAYSLQFWPKVVFSILQTLEGVRDFAREFPHKGSAYLVVFLTQMNVSIQHTYSSCWQLRFGLWTPRAHVEKGKRPSLLYRFHISNLSTTWATTSEYCGKTHGSILQNQSFILLHWIWKIWVTFG